MTALDFNLDVGDAPSTLVLEHQLCFALYSASRAYTASYRDALDELGITYPQYLVMLVLWEQDSVPVNHLARKLDLETGTLSPLLKRLETAGMVSRARSVDDERSVLISLTAKGDALRESAVCVQQAALPKLGMTIGEGMVLLQSLQKMTQRLRNRSSE